MAIENNWTFADIVSLAAGVVLFGLGAWISKAQENSIQLTKKLTEETKHLQTAIAELQLYEKIGVIGRGVHCVSQNSSEVSPVLLYDCLAILPMLEYCGKPLVEKYLVFLRQALDGLTGEMDGSKSMAAILVEAVLRQVSIIRKRGDHRLADDMINVLARYINNLKVNAPQQAEDICLQFLEGSENKSSYVRQIMDVETGDIFSIMKILSLGN